MWKLSEVEDTCSKADDFEAAWGESLKSDFKGKLLVIRRKTFQNF